MPAGILAADVLKDCSLDEWFDEPARIVNPAALTQAGLAKKNPRIRRRQRISPKAADLA
jgi:hypothetical protein